MPPEIVIPKSKGREKEETDQRYPDVDTLIDHTVTTDLEVEVDDLKHYSPAFLDNARRRLINPLASAPPLRLRSPIDHTGVGIHPIPPVIKKPPTPLPITVPAPEPAPAPGLSSVQNKPKAAKQLRVERDRKGKKGAAATVTKEDVVAEQEEVSTPPPQQTQPSASQKTRLDVAIDNMVNTGNFRSTLWGDSLEGENMNKKDDEVLLCEVHGKACSRGICEVYEIQIREQRKKLKVSQQSLDWQSRTGGPDDERDGRGDCRVVGGTGSIPLRGEGEFGKDSGLRSPTNGDFCDTKFAGIPSEPFFLVETEAWRGHQ